MPTTAEQIGLSLIEKRKAHAAHYGITIEESYKTVTAVELLHDPLFARYGPTFPNFSSCPLPTITHATILPSNGNPNYHVQLDETELGKIRNANRKDRKAQ